MRHQDRRAAVPAGEAGDAARGTVGVGRVVHGRAPAVVDEAQAHETGGLAGCRRGRVGELGAPLAVRHGDRHHRTRHAGEEYRRRGQHLDQPYAPLELLGPVAHEARPVRGAGHQVLQCRHHLAAVADAERERVGAFEVTLERLAHPRVPQDRLGPALAGTEHVAVGEPAAGDQSLVVVEPHATGDQVGHVHVDRREPGAMEHRGHLELAVDALLAQDRDRRPRTARHVRRAQVGVGVERQSRREPRVGRVCRARVLLGGAPGVVPHRLQP